MSVNAACRSACATAHAQQPGLQQAVWAGFTARMKALLNLPSMAGARASTSMPLAVRNWRGGFNGIYAGCFDVDGFEAGRVEFGDVFRIFEGACDAAYPQLDMPTHFGGNISRDDDIGDREPAAWFQYAEGFAQDAIFVGREVDHAIGNDDVDGIIGQGDILDLTLEEFDVVDAGFELVLAGQGEHFVGHVETVSFARGSYATGGEQDIDAAAG